MNPTVCDLTTPLGRVTISFGDIRLTPGAGGHELALPVTVSASWLEDGQNAPMLISGRLFVDGPGMRPIGAIATEVWAVRGYTVGEEMAITITSEQLLAMDALRQGGMLSLRLNLNGVLLQALPAVHPISGTQVAIIVHEPHWLRPLDQVGAEVGLLVRIPAPLVDQGALPAAPSHPNAPAVASRAQASARLRQARAELKDGRYEGCARSLRQVLDSLALLSPMPAAKSVFAKPAQRRSQDERWAVLHHCVYSLLSVAHHDDEITMDSTWSREDAETMLAVVGGLAARVLRG